MSEKEVSEPRYNQRVQNEKSTKKEIERMFYKKNCRAKILNKTRMFTTIDSNFVRGATKNSLVK